MIIYKAWFWNEAGIFEDSRTITKKERNEGRFKKDKKIYIYDSNASYKDSKFIPFIKKRFFFYNIKEIKPINMKTEKVSAIEPELLHVMLETEVAKQLNNVDKKGLKDLFTGRNILIGIVGIIAFIFIMNGGHF